MLEQNNKWRNKFNSSSLEKEDWLEPSDRLFAAIEEEIYEEKKKRRLLPWLLLGFSLLAVIVYVTYSSFSNEPKEVLSELDTNIITSDDEKSEMAALEAPFRTTTPAQEESINAKVKNERPQEISNPIQKRYNTKPITKAKSAQLSYISPKPVLRQGNSQKSIFNKQSATNSSRATISTLYTSTNSSKVLPGNTASRLPSAKAQLSFVDFLPTLENELLGKRGLSLSEANEYVESSLEIELSIPNQENISYKSSNNFYVNSGVNFTRFALNQNFSSAVDPADFTHSWGKGYAVTAGYSRKLSDRVDLFVELDHTRNTFTSGHNSAYNYDLSSEQNESQEANLTMATPLGFMEGSVLLLRNSAVSESEVGLVLDLHNEHKYSTAGLNLGIGYDLITVGTFDLGLNLGFGIQRLFDLNNSLSEVNTSNTDFGTSQTTITSNQQTIRKWLPKSVLGFDLLRDFCPHSRIGLSYRYHSGLKAIHSEGDLSTGVSEHRIQVKLLKDF